MPADPKHAPEWIERRARFMAAALGLSAWEVARIMNRAGTHGMEWRRSTKGSMADSYADGHAFGYPISENVIEALQLALRKKED